MSLIKFNCKFKGIEFPGGNLWSACFLDTITEPNLSSYLNIKRSGIHNINVINQAKSEYDRYKIMSDDPNNIDSLETFFGKEITIISHIRNQGGAWKIAYKRIANNFNDCIFILTSDHGHIFYVKMTDELKSQQLVKIGKSRYLPIKEILRLLGHESSVNLSRETVCQIEQVINKRIIIRSKNGVQMYSSATNLPSITLEIDDVDKWHSGDGKFAVIKPNVYYQCANEKCGFSTADLKDLKRHEKIFYQSSSFFHRKT